jgi:hypothetical protein
VARVELESGESEREPREALAGESQSLLDECFVERLAVRLAELLAERQRGDAQAELLDAAAVARRLGTNRSWVYEHQRELGAVRLGSGPKARLRFDPRKLEVLGVEADVPAAEEPPRARPRRRRVSRPAVPLLEIKGRR